MTNPTCQPVPAPAHTSEDPWCPALKRYSWLWCKLISVLELYSPEIEQICRAEDHKSVHHRACTKKLDHGAASPQFRKHPAAKKSNQQGGGHLHRWPWALWSRGRWTAAGGRSRWPWTLWSGGRGTVAGGWVRWPWALWTGGRWTAAGGRGKWPWTLWSEGRRKVLGGWGGRWWPWTLVRRQVNSNVVTM